jgi:steroid Delta-isomerase
MSTPPKVAPAQALLNKQLDTYIHFFNNLEQELTADNVMRLTQADVRFCDPFNDVQGQQNMHAVLAHFVSKVRNPSFAVTHSAWCDNICFIRWDFSGMLPTFGQWTFSGVSELHFNADGKVFLHLDHWDAAQHFYEKLPILGRLIAFIRRRIALGL